MRDILLKDMSDREIEQLREIIDAQPLRFYGPLIVKVLNALPLTESAAVPPSPDSSPEAPKVPETSGGFSEAVRQLEGDFDGFVESLRS